MKMEKRSARASKPRISLGKTIAVSRRGKFIDLPFIAENYNFSAFDTPDKMLRFLNHLVGKNYMTLARFRRIMRKCADAVSIPLVPFEGH